VCKSNPSEVTNGRITSLKLTTAQETNSVDFVVDASGDFTFSKAGLYKLSAYVSIYSIGYNARINCCLAPFINDVYDSSYPIGYGYIRGTTETVRRCSCQVDFMIHLNVDDVVSFVIEMPKSDDGTFGDELFNTNVETQSVMFEYLGA